MSDVLLTWQPAYGPAVILDDRAAAWKFTLTEGLDSGADFRGSDQVVPFLPGSVRWPRIADARALVLTGRLKSDSPVLYHAAVDALMTAFDAGLGPGTLTALIDGMGTRQVGAVVKDIAWGGKHSPIARAVSILLDGDPFWQSPSIWGTAWTMDMGLYADTGLTMDMATSTGVVFNPVSDPDSMDFLTFSTTTVRDAIIEVDGPSSGAITVKNSEGVGIYYPALVGGETLAVDCGEKTVTLNGTPVRNLMALAAPNPRGDYFFVRPGSDSLVVVGQPAEVRLTFRPTYL